VSVSGLPHAAALLHLCWRPDARVLRCTGCRKVLAWVADDAILVRHYRREVEVAGAGLRLRQVCDDCGTANHWPPATGD
jgi:hypothetical protein